MTLPQKTLVYLAAPYTFQGKFVGFEVKERVLWIDRCSAWLFKQGLFVYSPISHTHPIKEADPILDGGWTFWSDYDKRMIGHCDAFAVLMLQGWAESVGVTAELKIAKDLNKQIFFIHQRPQFRLSNVP